MTKKIGEIWNFIKSLFGFENPERKSSFPVVSDEVIDAELNDSKFVYDEEKNRREAAEMIAKSLEDEKIDPHDPNVYFSRATGYSILGDNAAALELIEKALSMDDKFLNAYRLKATIYEESEDYEEVIKILDQAIARHTDEPEEAATGGILPDLDEIMFQQNNRERAEDYEKRAAALVRLEDFASAIDDFTRAIEIDPDNDYLYANRGEAYSEVGEYDRALADLNVAIEIEANEYSYAKRARIYKESGDFEAALRDISKAIEINAASDSEFAKYFGGYFDRAEIYMEKGDYDSAVRDYTTQIELDPEFIDPYERRAVAYRFLGMDAQAEADDRKANELTAEMEASDSN